MLSVAQGQQVTVPFTFTDDAQNAVNVTSPTVTLTDPSGNTVESAQVPTATGATGAYQFVYAVGATAALGVWTTTWSATYAGSSIGGVALFNVTGAGGNVIATWQDVQTYVNRTFDAAEQTFVTDVIGYLQGEMETYLKRPVTVRWFYDEPIMQQDQVEVFLRNTPLWQITEVVVNPESNSPATLDPATYDVMPWGIILADPTYQLLFRPGDDNLYRDVTGVKVGITYQAGLDGPNTPTIKSLLVRAASREYLAMASDVQNVSMLRAGTMTQWTFADGNRGGFSSDELKRIKRFRRRVAA